VRWKRLGVRRLVIDIALQRIRLLWRMSVDAVREGKFDLAREYIDEALRLVKRFRLEKPLFLRRWVCSNCLLPLVPGLTARVRLEPHGKDTRIVITCLICGYIHRLQVRRGRCGTKTD